MISVVERHFPALISLSLSSQHVTSVTTALLAAVFRLQEPRRTASLLIIKNIYAAWTDDVF